MSTLNKLPDGSDSPEYDCTAVSRFDGTEKTLRITEWWNEGRRVETIAQSAEGAFYDAFDKEPFKVIEIAKVG